MSISIIFNINIRIIYNNTILITIINFGCYFLKLNKNLYFINFFSIYFFCLKTKFKKLQSHNYWALKEK